MYTKLKNKYLKITLFTKSLTETKFGSIKSHYPPLPEQQQIAAILSNIDDTLQKTDKIIKQTQRLKKGMIQKLLTHFNAWVL